MTVIDLRDKAREQANISAETLLESLTRTLERDFELYGLSLQAVAERLRNPALEGVSDEVRHLGLFRSGRHRLGLRRDLRPRRARGGVPRFPPP